VPLKDVINAIPLSAASLTTLSFFIFSQPSIYSISLIQVFGGVVKKSVLMSRAVNS